MVDLHKPQLYENCEVETDYECADGVVRTTLFLPSCPEDVPSKVLDSRIDQIKDRLGEMRLCLVWYGMCRLSFQPHIYYIEHKFGETSIYCGTERITEQQVNSFVQMQPA